MYDALHHLLIYIEYEHETTARIVIPRIFAVSRKSLDASKASTSRWRSAWQTRRLPPRPLPRAITAISVATMTTTTTTSIIFLIHKETLQLCNVAHYVGENVYIMIISPVNWIDIIIKNFYDFLNTVY